jgi:hypothetical protein
MRPTTIPAALVCWFLFVLAGVAGLVTGLLALPFKRTRRYTSDLVHAQDCAAAAFLGWSGERTISKECGLELLAADVKKPCRFCRVLCFVLHFGLESEHCKKETKRG